jgi:hypothetical protein
MSKGGSTSTSVQVPEYIEEAAKRNLARADTISQIGYVPYYGPDVAAFTPTQEAAFQNVAGQAGAFGLAAPEAGVMAGMPAPQDFAGGVRGYSSAPLFEQAQADLAAKRPAQVNLMDSLFIDPFTGQVGSNVAAPIDYSQLGTVADIREADRQRDLAVAEMNMQGSALSAPEYNTYVNTIQETIGDPTYNPATDVLTQSQINAINNNPDAQLAQDAIYMNQLGNANATIGDALTTLTGGEPSFDSPSGAGSYGGSLVTGELSTDLLGVPGLVGEVADNIYQNVDFEGAVQAQGENFAEMAGSELQDDGTYDISSWFTDTSATPTNADLAAKTETFSQMGDDLTPPPVTYDGSSKKNAAVAAILKDTYGWSDEQLTSGGYEGYAENAEGVGAPAPAPAPEPAPAPSDTSFVPTFEAGVAAADDDPFGVQLPTQQQQDFASTVLAADDVSAFTAPVVNTSNDNDNFVPTTSSGATVIPTGTTIATGTVLNKADDPVVEVDGKLYNQSKAPAPASSGGGNDDGGGGGGGGGGGVCVVATHAVNSGAFTPSMKREAVVWCMNVLHDKWWGEAIRRGYRHLGRKKIEQGKAHEHYQEFRDYIAFANGKKRTLKGAVSFTLRTAQFFAVGLIKKEA